MKNSFLKVDKNSWKKILTKEQRKLVKELEDSMETTSLFYDKIEDLTSKTILAVRNGEAVDPKLIKRVRRAGFINEVYEYSVNFGIFSSWVLERKFRFCGTVDYFRNCAAPGFSKGIKEYEDYDVCFTGKSKVFYTNGLYESITSDYSVNAKAIPEAERILKDLIGPECFEVVKKIYLHPGPIAEADQDERKIIIEAQKRLDKRDTSKLLRKLYVSDERIQQRASITKEVIIKSGYIEKLASLGMFEEGTTINLQTVKEASEKLVRKDMKGVNDASSFVCFYKEAGRNMADISRFLKFYEEVFLMMAKKDNIHDIPLEDEEFLRRLNACEGRLDRVRTKVVEAMSDWEKTVNQAKWFLELYKRFAFVTDRGIYSDIYENPLHQ